MTFYLKNYEVVVTGYGAEKYYAKDKNQARWKSFNTLSSLYDGMLFKDFLKLRPRINEVPAPEGFGRQILVSGEPAHWIEQVGNSVRFIRPHESTILLAHELNVEELPSTPPVEEA